MRSCPVPRQQLSSSPAAQLRLDDLWPRSKAASASTCSRWLRKHRRERLRASLAAAEEGALKREGGGASQVAGERSLQAAILIRWPPRLPPSPGPHEERPGCHRAGALGAEGLVLPRGEMAEWEAVSARNGNAAGGVSSSRQLVETCARGACSSERCSRLAARGIASSRLTALLRAWRCCDEPRTADGKSSDDGLSTRAMAVPDIVYCSEQVCKAFSCVPWRQYAELSAASLYSARTQIHPQSAQEQTYNNRR